MTQPNDIIAICPRMADVTEAGHELARKLGLVNVAADCHDCEERILVSMESMAAASRLSCTVCAEGTGMYADAEPVTPEFQQRFFDRLGIDADTAHDVTNGLTSGRYTREQAQEIVQQNIEDRKRFQ